MNPKLIPYIQRRKKEIATAKELLIKLEGMINSLENDLDDLDQHIPILTTPEKVEKEIDQIEMNYWLVNTELNGLNKIFDRPEGREKDRTEYFLDR
jgi:hypothetical protein